jgi:pSer/pThr/pTyr-binding forkhead associated (FHA) protein
MAVLKVTDASGRQAQHQLTNRVIMIGRAPDNQIVLDDPRASRHHAHIKPTDDGSFALIDGVFVNGQIKRSANKVFVNGEQKFEYKLKDGDRVTIGASTIRFEQPKEERTADLSFDDKPLGHTQLLMSAKDVLQT